MTFAAYWSRASLRRRWQGLVGIVLLLGLIGGLSLFTLAGARRTQSAYPRFLRSTNPSTMAVVVGELASGGQAALEENAQLPDVVQARAYFAFNVAEWVDVSGASVTRGGSFADDDVASLSSLSLRAVSGADVTVGFRCAKDD